MSAHPAAALAIHDIARLRALRETGLLDSEAEAAFDRFTRLAARYLQVPLAAITLLEDKRQFLKSTVGMGDVRETDIEYSFCQHAVASRKPLVIADARIDSVLHDNPSVQAFGAIAYAGIPLITSDKMALGALCAVDTSPRAWTDDQIAFLSDLASAVVAEIELRIANQKLRSREAMFSALSESASDAIVTADERGNIAHWNSAAEQMFGYSATEVIGQPLAILMPERHRAAHGAGLRRVRNGGEPHLVGRGTVEIEAIRRSGEEFPVELALSRWDSPQGMFFTGILRDVTQRKLHADALRRSEEQFRLTIDYAPIGMALVDLNGRFMRVNRALCDIVGYDADVLVTLTFQQITHPDDLEKDLNLLDKLVRGEIARYQLAKRYIHADGHFVDIMLNVSLVHGKDGAPLHFIAQIEDVTTRRKAEDELEHKTMILETVLANMHDGVMMADKNGKMMLANPAALRMLDTAADNPNWREGCSVTTADGSRELEDAELPVARALRGEYVEQAEILVRTLSHVDGRWHSVSASPLRHPDGSIWAALTVARDVTRLKQAEIALREQTSIIRLLEAVAVAANEATTSKRALQDCLRLVCEYMRWPLGHVYLVQDEELLPSELWHLGDRDKFARFRDATVGTRLGFGRDLPGRVLATGRPAFMEDVQQDPMFSRRRAAEELGMHGGFAFPVLVGNEIVAVLEFYAEQPAVFDARTLDVMQQVGTQLGRVVERERHAEDVRNLSLTDELTGLNNRRGFMTLAESQLRLSLRNRTRCLLLFLDMDGLKQINDKLGHELGDAALIQLASVMRSTFRDADILGRLGGDEFVALLPDTSETDAYLVLERFQEGLTHSNVAEQRKYMLAASAGVTVFDPQFPRSVDELLREADMLMYEQKRRRKGEHALSVVRR